MNVDPHTAAVACRAAFVALSFVDGVVVVTLVDLLVPGAIVTAILHVVLMVPLRRGVTA